MSTLIQCLSWGKKGTVEINNFCIKNSRSTDLCLIIEAGNFAVLFGDEHDPTQSCTYSLPLPGIV